MASDFWAISTPRPIARSMFPAEATATTHDLVLQNHDVFFVDTATDMCEFTMAGVVDHNYEGYLEGHPVTRQILADMAKVEASVLTATYRRCAVRS